MKLTIIVDRHMYNLGDGLATWKTYAIEKADGTYIETDDWFVVLKEFDNNIPEPEVLFVD